MKKIERQNYFIAFLLLMTGIKHSNIISNSPYLLFFVFAIFLYYFFNRKYLINSKPIINVLTFTVIYLSLYIIKFVSFDPSFTLFTLLRVFIAILAIYLLTPFKLLIYIKNIIYYGALISLPLYFLQLLNFELVVSILKSLQSLFSFNDKLDIKLVNIIIWGVHDVSYGENRNCGFMWEPGAFAAFLIIGLLIELSTNHFQLNRKVVIMSLAVLSTLSTMGYIGLVIIILYYILFVSKKKLHSLLLVPLLIGSILVIVNLEFVFLKVENELESQDQVLDYAYRADRDFASLGRIGSLIADVNDLKKEPILGIGGKEELMWGIKGKIINRTNGLSKFLLKFGIAGFLIFFYLTTLSFKHLGKNWGINYSGYSLFSVLILFITTFSNDIILTPFFFSLPITYFVIKDNRF